MKIAVVEDEKRWRMKIENLLRAYEWKEAIEVDLFSNGESFYKKRDYDIVFMDIELGKMDGFKAIDLYKQNNEKFILIFVTTHMEICNRGYLMDAFRYIDKANVEDELREALNAVELLQQRNHVLKFHVINLGDVYLKLKDIMFIETEKRNVIIHAKEQCFLSNRKIEELEKELEPWGFYRCHKSYLVNLDNIVKPEKVHVLFCNGEKAFVSTRRYVELKNRYLKQKFKTANS